MGSSLDTHFRSESKNMDSSMQRSGVYFIIAVLEPSYFYAVYRMHCVTYRPGCGVVATDASRIP